MLGPSFRQARRERPLLKEPRLDLLTREFDRLAGDLRRPGHTDCSRQRLRGIVAWAETRVGSHPSAQALVDHLAHLATLTSVDAAMLGQRAVLSALGFSGRKGTEALLKATENIVAAMRKYRVHRFICLAPAPEKEGWARRGLLGRFLSSLLRKSPSAQAWERQLDSIRGSPLEWVLVRPTRLTDDAARKSYQVSVGWAEVPEGIPRADVAAFMLEQIVRDEHNRHLCTDLGTERLPPDPALELRAVTGKRRCERDPVRDLPRQFSAAAVPQGVTDVRVFCGGCLVVGGPSYVDEPAAPAAAMRGTSGTEQRIRHPADGALHAIAAADAVHGHDHPEQQGDAERQQVQQLAPLRTEYLQINYAKASDLSALIKSGQNSSLLSERGSVATFPYDLDYKVGERLVSMVPGVDLIRFANSGTEATMARLAMAATALFASRHVLHGVLPGHSVEDCVTRPRSVRTCGAS